MNATIVLKNGEKNATFSETRISVTASSTYIWVGWDKFATTVMEIMPAFEANFVAGWIVVPHRLVDSLTLLD